MTKPEDQIHVKCDYCGEMFTTSRVGLDSVGGQVISISSHFGITLLLPHPIINSVMCQYTIIADKGDFCPNCSMILLQAGLIKLSQ